MTARFPARVGAAARAEAARRPGRAPLLLGLAAGAALFASPAFTCNQLPGQAAGAGGLLAPPRAARAARVARRAVEVTGTACMVGETTVPGKLATWIGNSISANDGNGEDVHVRALSRVVYKAVKAVLFAARDLEDDGALLAVPEWKTVRNKADGKNFVVTDMTFRMMPPSFSWDAQAMTLKAGKDTLPEKLAGAIAKQLRIKGQVNVRGIGREAVTRAMSAVIKSAEFLQQADHPKAIVGISPVFETLARVGTSEKADLVKLRIGGFDPPRGSKRLSAVIGCPQPGEPRDARPDGRARPEFPH
eukprot:CAMPEP_0197891908 /NCGR_PEP_ID=MMETSP1439-20131203/29864_1 /TAXON_ID=66791 /ORGANISM="Gonyaulax spinifera, Strain CCMP409" /LENGTH=303 /DNA_ID=CAMNT_0043512047 /DNA_START=62 /DNA_END=974 /DNA_ORIENTATION=-